MLLTMAESFQKRRDEVNDSASSVMAAIEHNESFVGRAGNPGPELVAKLVMSALKQFDARSGGFRFPTKVSSFRRNRSASGCFVASLFGTQCRYERAGEESSDGNARKDVKGWHL